VFEKYRQVDPVNNAIAIDVGASIAFSLCTKPQCQVAKINCAVVVDVTGQPDKE